LEATARRIEVPGTKPGPVHIQAPAAPWVGQSIGATCPGFGQARPVSASGSDAGPLQSGSPLAKPALKVTEVPHGVGLPGPLPRAPVSGSTASRRATRSPRSSPRSRLRSTPIARFNTGRPMCIQSRPSSPAATPRRRAMRPSRSRSRRRPVPAHGPRRAGGDRRGFEYRIELESGDGARSARLLPLPVVNGGPFEKLGDLLATPAYGDRAIETGKHYRYQVSAVNQRGHGSARSPIVEMAAP